MERLIQSQAESAKNVWQLQKLREKKDSAEINKGFRRIWHFTYRILYEDKKRVKVVNKDSDNLLVSWVAGGRTITELLKELNVSSQST